MKFVVVEQHAPSFGWVGKVTITAEDWPVIRDAIDRMIADCREDRDE